MIAGKNEYLNEASSELFKRLADLAVQEECEAREQYYKDFNLIFSSKNSLRIFRREFT